MSINETTALTAVILTLSWGSPSMVSVVSAETTQAISTSGWIRGGARTPALIRVYEENADGTKGTPLIDERWIKQNELVRVSSARGRIIYDFKLFATGTWATDVHTECRGSRRAATAVP